MACTLNKSLSFECTEIDQTSLDYGVQNVILNKLEDRIYINLQSNAKKPLSRKLMSKDFYNFCICNPPFYSSHDDITQCRDLKPDPPNGICTGSEHEMITQGGELEFITKLLKQSYKHRVRIQWFTSLLGKKENAYKLLELVRKSKGNPRVGVKTVTCGRTSRWILYWTYIDSVPDMTHFISQHQ